MFTFKELFEPIPDGEKKFVAKHIKKATPDAAKNDDEIFTASNVKAVNRGSNRMGSAPKKDANGQDSDNIQIKNPNLPVMAIGEEDLIDELSRKTLKSYVKKSQVSRNGLRKTADDAAANYKYGTGSCQYDKGHPKWKDESDWASHSASNREKGTSLAKKKLKEDEELEEQWGVYDSKSKRIVGKHANKESAEVAARVSDFAHYHRTTEKGRYSPVNVKGFIGQKFPKPNVSKPAAKKPAKKKTVKEEFLSFGDIQELSSTTLKSYKEKSSKDKDRAERRERSQGDLADYADRRGDTVKRDKHLSREKSYSKTFYKRHTGLINANKRLKEDSDDLYRTGKLKGHYEDGHCNCFNGWGHVTHKNQHHQQAFDRGYLEGSKRRENLRKKVTKEEVLSQIAELAIQMAANNKGDINEISDALEILRGE